MRDPVATIKAEVRIACSACDQPLLSVRGSRDTEVVIDAGMTLTCANCGTVVEVVRIADRGAGK